MALLPQSPFLRAPRPTSGQDDGRWPCPLTPGHPPLWPACWGLVLPRGLHRTVPGRWKTQQGTLGPAKETESQVTTGWHIRAQFPWRLPLATSIIGPGSSFLRSRGEHQPCPRGILPAISWNRALELRGGVRAAARIRTHTHLHKNKQRLA